MKQHPLKLSSMGCGFALLCFFLPWIKYDFSSIDPVGMVSKLHGTGTISGIQFVIGGAKFEILGFLALFAILGFCLYMFKQQTPWKARIPVLIFSISGALYFLYRLVLTIVLNNLMTSKAIEYLQPEVNIGNVISIQIGMYGVLIGFVVALIGAWKIPKSDASIQENEDTESFAISV